MYVKLLLFQELLFFWQAGDIYCLRAFLKF